MGSGSWCRTVYSFTHIVCVQLAEKTVQFSSVFQLGQNPSLVLLHSTNSLCLILFFLC